ncbi:type VI secretion system protein VasG [Andreprevotia lacus DSM 23236]|jgi:type VI secretion system protein VasG|uniref:Type VI secretion system protein VasG n=1 Tax=Andreprevotia lacus DSM 23236 TaxID=1121001 RepID=A0A1W1XFT8_9NEIS|nr:type VI secretion system ATPase TssH [Andreprevotia lacus]SMC22846.1 type VI secretion system protein VasG [Andreprevotia lacus DSM 23236]
MSTDLKSLIGKLNPICRGAMESAAGLAISRGHYEVDVEHLLMKVLESDNTDLAKVLRHYGIDPSRFERDLNNALDGFKSGNTRNPVLASNLPKLFQKAWLVASVDFNETRVRSGHLLLALLSDDDLAQLVKQWSKDLAGVSADDLKKNLDAITADSREAATATTLGSGPAASGAPAASKGGKTPALDQYTVNLTERARQNQIDPVLGRDSEIRQMVDILTRRRQNNPILTGEAGVGKTAVVEGLALRIAASDVPPILQNVELHMLDLGLLQAGASVKGEFENRLKSVIEETKASIKPIIMFIDEAHTLIGAGGQAGQNDAANLLKPALARGELRTIAATTWSEYKKYFEKDPALTRRFQVVKVDEPDEEKGVIMLRGLLEKMQGHHKVRVLDEALVSAVKLSHRYITGRQLPDKAVSVLDTACARIAIGQSATPAQVEDTRRHIEGIATEIRVLNKETASGGSHDSRLAELTEAKQQAEDELAKLEARWAAELELVQKIRDVQDQLEADAEAAEPGQNRPALLAELNRLNDELAALQGKDPLVQVCVDEATVGAVISAWTGIPLGKMVQDELETVLKLKDTLAERVIGQDHALEAIAQRIRISRAGLEDPGKPIGVFMLVGTSGVGKTETALALADILYGGERNLITINMSEFQEAHTVSSLKGSPPGYVGYGEGGILTEAVRRKPYSVVLLDEVEKAHPDVLEMFFQVFDKGMMDDAEGREINFKNCVILLTSNAGTDIIMDACRNATVMPTEESLRDALRDELNQVFKPAFLGRMQVVPFYPVKDEVLKQIVRLKLNKIKKRVKINHNAAFAYDEALVEAIAARCTEVDSGARNIDNIVSGTLLPEVAGAVLARMAEGQAVERIDVTIGGDGQYAYTVA